MKITSDFVGWSKLREQGIVIVVLFLGSLLWSLSFVFLDYISVTESVMCLVYSIYWLGPPFVIKF